MFSGLSVDWSVYLGFIEVFYSHTVHGGTQLARSARLIIKTINKQITSYATAGVMKFTAVRLVASMRAIWPPTQQA